MTDHNFCFLYVPGSMTVENDVALIKLPEKVNLRSSPFIRDACLPQTRDFLQQVQDKDMIYVAGWGVTGQ